MLRNHAAKKVGGAHDAQPIEAELGNHFFVQHEQGGDH
jgi:hypothetical protein